MKTGLYNSFNMTEPKTRVGKAWRTYQENSPAALQAKAEAEAKAAALKLQAEQAADIQLVLSGDPQNKDVRAARARLGQRIEAEAASVAWAPEEERPEAARRVLALARRAVVADGSNAQSRFKAVDTLIQTVLPVLPLEQAKDMAEELAVLSSVKPARVVSQAQAEERNLRTRLAQERQRTGNVRAALDEALATDPFEQVAKQVRAARNLTTQAEQAVGLAPRPATRQYRVGRGRPGAMNGQHSTRG